MIARYALDDGTLDDLSDHGTYVASAAVSAIDSWGSAGIWPQGKIVSMRASTAENPDGYSYTSYAYGIQECVNNSIVDNLNVKVINLSFSSAADSEGDLVWLNNAISYARDTYDINIVAAAGNDGNTSTVSYPAKADKVLAVGATDSGGSFCSFSNRGEGLDISAPGCPVYVSYRDGQVATASGTSFSTPIVAAALAALRSYRSDLSATEAEELILDSAQQTAAGKVLDLSAAFRAAGLGSYVDAYVPPASSSSTPSSAATSSQSSSALSSSSAPTVSDIRSSLKRPRIKKIYRSKKRLFIWLREIPEGCTVYIRSGKKLLKIKASTVKGRVGIPISGRWQATKIRFFRQGDGFTGWTKVAPRRYVAP